MRRVELNYASQIIGVEDHGVLAWKVVRSKRARSLTWTGATVMMKTGVRLASKKTARSAKRDARSVAQVIGVR